MPNGRISSISEAFKESLAQYNVDSQADELYEEIKDFLEKGAPDDTNDITFFISKDRIKLILKSAFLDLLKYKNFHPYEEREEYLNQYKKASILVKWIIKIKPIIAIKSGNEKKALYFANKSNELFSFYYSLKVCGVNKGKRKKLSKNTKDRIVYNFFYRDYNENIYTLFLESI